MNLPRNRVFTIGVFLFPCVLLVMGVLYSRPIGGPETGTGIWRTGFRMGGEETGAWVHIRTAKPPAGVVTARYAVSIPGPVPFYVGAQDWATWIGIGSFRH